MDFLRCGLPWVTLTALGGAVYLGACGGKVTPEIPDGGPAGQGSGSGGTASTSSGSFGSSGSTSGGSSSSSGISSSGMTGSGSGSTSGGSGSTSGGSGSTSSSSGGGSTSGGGYDGSSSSSGGTSSSSSSGGCFDVALSASATGYVNVPALNIVGSSFVYGDGQGPNGFPPGICETMGQHSSSECSMITFPASGASPQTMASTMCMSGRAAQVIGTPPDYANMYGIGMGVAFNSPDGSADPYDATQNHVTGFRFNVTGLPTLGAVQVVFPEPATDATGDAWGSTLTANGPVTVLLQAGFGASQLVPAFTPPFGTGTQPAFDPTTVEAMEFHVVTSVTNAVPVSGFCIDSLAAIVCP